MLLNSIKGTTLLTFICFSCLVFSVNSFRVVLKASPSTLRMSNFVAAEKPVVSERIIKHINAWCGLHGLMYTDGHVTWTPAPLSLLPNPFPRSSFEYAQSIQTTWNKLIDRISRDRHFITKELSSVSNADQFTLRLMNMYDKVPEDVLTSGLQFGILRSDYMINFDNRPLQVEINTISSSFGCLSKKVPSLHKFLLNRNVDDKEMKDLVMKTLGNNMSPEQLSDAIVENTSMEKLASSIAAAHHAYGNDNAIVLFVVQPNERNQGDQRALEYQLWTAHGVKCEFLTLAELSRLTCVDSDGKLIITKDDSDYEVSVSYYRAGYTPNDYPSEEEWKARELIETSKSIKCPSVGYHLAGTKAIQAALCKPGVLERFLSADECEKLRLCFAEQYSLGDAETKDAAQQAVDAASKDGTGWVLKPQREGGGNNYYNENLSRFLIEHRNDPLLSGFVLMQRIFPKLQSTIFCRQGHCELGQSISELGIYGTYLGYGAKCTGESDLVNEYAGYLLRTKGSGTDEGGVATGYSVLNSVALHD